MTASSLKLNVRLSVDTFYNYKLHNINHHPNYGNMVTQMVKRIHNVYDVRI